MKKQVSACMAVSGAAVSVDMGHSFSASGSIKLALLLLGVSLGSWIRTPLSYQKNTVSSSNSVHNIIMWLLLAVPLCLHIAVGDRGSILSGALLMFSVMVPVIMVVAGEIDISIKDVLGHSFEVFISDA